MPSKALWETRRDDGAVVAERVRPVHGDRVGLGVLDDPLDAAGPCPGLLGREYPADLVEVQVLQLEVASILGRPGRRRGAEVGCHWTPPRGGATAVRTRAALSSSEGQVTRAVGDRWIAAKNARVRVCM